MITVLCLSGRASPVSAISRAVTVYTLSIGTARGIGGGRPPDVESLRAKEVQRCAAKGWKSALVCINNMRKGGVSPGTRAYNIALEACIEAGEWGRAVELLGEMRNAGVAANTTLSKMIESTSSGGPEHQHDSPPRS